MAVTYHEPNNQEILIRTDKLPIDVDTMRWLSKQLTTIAERENSGTADQLRANAQLIALAKRLDPDNKEAIKLNQDLIEGENYEPAGNEAVSKATSRVWSLVQFLSNESAGKEANTLSNCIKDAMVVVDPTHPVLAEFKPSTERWGGTVASLDKFKEESIIASADQSNNSRITDVPVDPIVKNDWQTDAESNNKKEEPEATASWHNTKTRISVPAQEYVRIGDNDTYRFHLISVSAEIKPNESSEDKKLIFNTSSGEERYDFIRRIEHPVKRVLSKFWKDIPSAKIDLKLANALGGQNQDYIQSAMILFLDSSLSNKDYNSNTLPLTSIDENGKFVRSDDFWEAMILLSKDTSTNRRVLASKDTEGDFRQLLALEKADFFAQNEVILVEGLKESRKYTSTTSDEKIKEATALFAEFQQVASSRSIGALSANKHVRERMEKILQLMPNHLSAKMILLQGSGSRPVKLESKYLAYALDSMTQPVEKYLDRINSWSENSHWNSQNLESVSSELEKNLDNIKGYIDSSDNVMYNSTTDIISNLKSIARATDRLKGGDEKKGYYEKIARNSYDNLKSSYIILDAEIAKATGRKTKEFNRGFNKGFNR